MEHSANFQITEEQLKYFNNMKPTKKQIELIKFCKSILQTWEDTNDINSPTHYVDLEEFIHSDYDDFEELIGVLSDLFDIIKQYDNNKR